MPLYLIGTGLGNEQDLTLRGLDLIRNSDRVFLESYTSVPSVSTFSKKLHELTGKAVESADRFFVEDATELLFMARTQEVSLLIVGDPFSATTHSDLYVRCRNENIPVEVVHNASIVNAVGFTGLQLYRFGPVVTLCFWTDNWTPRSWFPTLEENVSRGLHTLILLDIKTKEVSDENLARGKLDVFEPPRFMNVHQAMSQIQSVARECCSESITDDTCVIAIGRLGSQDQKNLPWKHWVLDVPFRK
mmetsp:Transcript_18503/g.28988  ORF Transcript_18503/g.28988 Transcript_18503/m.28988 type:complete len:246 (-) Transcript_18503:139-876(-)